ncbi:unnamed protein product [Diamesa serratosioi]
MTRRSSSSAHRIINLPLNVTMACVENATNAATSIFQSIPNALSKSTTVDSPCRSSPCNDSANDTRNFLEIPQIDFPDFKKVCFTRYIPNPI